LFEARMPRPDTKNNIPMKKKNVPIAVRAIAVEDVVTLALIWRKHVRQAFPVTLRAGYTSHNPKLHDNGARS